MAVRRFKKRRAHLPINEMFAQSKYRDFGGEGQHGPVKVIFSRDANPVVDPPTPKGMLAGELRREAPECERILRDALKVFAPYGVTFQHSVAMFGYIADFYCPERKTIIELDGPHHKETEDYDRRRDVAFAKNGIRTLRYTSAWAHRNIDSLISRIAADLLIHAA